MTIPATIATGGHVTDPEIVDAQLAILQLLLAFTNGVLNAANGGTGTSTSPLPIANGGTAGSATPTNGGSAYGTGTAFAFTAVGTSGQLLQSAGAAAPIWAGETAWTAPTLLNSWVNVGGVFQNASYMKDASGFVHLRGAIKSGALNTVMFVLPAGYRPSATMEFAICAANAFGQVFVDSSGDVEQNVGALTETHLDNIHFDTR